VRVHNESQEEFGQPLTVLDLTQLPTIEALAVFLAPDKRKNNILTDENEEELKRFSEGKRVLICSGRGQQKGNKAWLESTI